jgi:hypothetical protein
VVNGAKGALLATGAAITVPKGTNGQWYVSRLSGLALTSGTRYVLALDPAGTNSTMSARKPTARWLLRGLSMNGAEDLLDG